MLEQIINMIVAAVVIGFLVVSFILVCCVYALGKSNHRQEFDKEQEKELKGVTRKEAIRMKCNKVKVRRTQHPAMQITEKKVT